MMNTKSTRRRSPAPRRPELWRGEVVEVVDDDVVQVRRAGAAPSALDQAELSVPGYAPRAGDRVLVQRGADGWFVVGALGEARRRSPIRCEGDDVIVAATGRLMLRGGEAVDIRADEVITTAGRLEMHARRIVEHAQEAYRETEGLSQTRAGRVRLLVEGAFQLFAKRTSLASEEDTAIDGRRVLLG